MSITRATRARLRRSHRFAFHASAKKQPACLSSPSSRVALAPSLPADVTSRCTHRRPSTWLTKARFPPSCAITAPAWSRCANVPRSGHTPRVFRCRSKVDTRGPARRSVPLERTERVFERAAASKTDREIHGAITPRRNSTGHAPADRTDDPVHGCRGSHASASSIFSSSDA